MKILKLHEESESNETNHARYLIQMKEITIICSNTAVRSRLSLLKHLSVRKIHIFNRNARIIKSLMFLKILYPTMLFGICTNPCNGVAKDWLPWHQACIFSKTLHVAKQGKQGINTWSTDSLWTLTTFTNLQWSCHVSFG